MTKIVKNMAHKNQPRLLLFTAMLLFFFSPWNILGAKTCWFSTLYKVVLLNELADPTNPLRVHCASADDDLGNHTITTSSRFWGWDFCGDVFGRTVFFCHFWWGPNKDRAFEVFNRHLTKKACGTVCRWVARPDGLYLNDGVYTPVKMYDWRRKG